jgi:hypothetical protein
MADATNPQIYALKFGTDMFVQAQQGKSLLMDKVVLKSNVVGKAFTQPRIGKWSMTLKGARGQKNAQNDPVLSNRYISLATYEDSRVWTAEDEWKTIVSLGSPAMNAAASSLGRQIDSVVIAALGGTAYAGEAGGTSVTLPTTQKVAVGTTNLTVAKILAAAKIMDENNVDAEGRVFVVSPSALHSLLSDPKATSGDYVNLKALIAGTIDTFYGFKFVVSTLLSKSSNTRYCYAFQKNAVTLGMNTAPIVRLDELVDQSYDKQVFYTMGLGAGRLEEESVVEVAVDETK